MSARAAASGNVAWRLLACMIPLAVLSQFYRSSTGVIAPELSTELSLSTEQIGIVSGAFFIAITVLQLPIGIMLDRFGPRRVIVSMMGLAVLGSVAFALGQSFTGLVVARVLIAAGFAAVTIGSVVILRNWLPAAELSAAMSVLFAAANAGSLVATSPLALASVSIGWRNTFIGLALISVACALLFYLFLRDRPTGEAPAATAEPFGAAVTGILDVLRIREIRLVMPLVTVGYASVIAVVGLWGGPYLHDVHGLDTIARGNTLSIMAVALVLGTLLYGPLEKRFGDRRRVVTIGTLCTAAPLLALALWPQPSVASATALLSLFALASGFSVVVMAHGMSLLPQRLTGRGATTLNIALLGGAALIQSVSGALIDAVALHLGAAVGYAVLFAALAAVLGAALLCYRRIEAGVKNGNGIPRRGETRRAEAAE
jgi:predicted MFS family arabinose efflux permease